MPTGTFAYTPGEHEAEKASNSYLMSLVALMLGAPLPIVNLLATLIFYLSNRKGSYFVRWHCTQALFSQLSVLLINSSGLYWTLAILFGHVKVSDRYVAYLIAAILFNLIEFVATIYTAINTRKGNHVEWWAFGALTNLVCKA